MRASQIFERVRNMEQMNSLASVFFAVILVFGVMNCILGYRLLRFWMMLGGFMLGAALGLFGCRWMDVTDKMVYAAAALGAGVLFAVVAFLVYKAGVFMLGAGIGWTVSIYIIHPMSSASFFACVLIGVALGAMGVRYCREVLVVATSLMGGLMAGFSLAKLGSLAEFPYGIAMSAAFAILGMLIQFAINKPSQDEEEEYEAEEEEPEEEKDRREEADTRKQHASAERNGKYKR